LPRREVADNTCSQSDQDHTDELTDVEQFRMAHPVVHSANAGQRRANGDEDIAD
jgi:hypothetical protein